MTDPKALRWGVVATVKAPLRRIAEFAAWHLELGAHRVSLYLDTPEPVPFNFLRTHRKLRVIACDDAYWADKNSKARRTHQRRQVLNASRCYHHSKLDWLGHLDVDEFLLPQRPIAQILSAVSPDSAALRVTVAEMLTGPGPTTHFKRPPRTLGLPKSVLHDLYPTFGDLLPQGFLGYTTHKQFARVGLGPLRFGIHRLLVDEGRLSNIEAPEDLNIGHAHTYDFDHFLEIMHYRMTHGSYRDQQNGNPRLHALLTGLMADEDPNALRQFYDEYCTARPALLAALSAQDLLISREMDLEGVVARHFGALPETDR